MLGEGVVYAGGVLEQGSLVVGLSILWVMGCTGGVVEW